ncbi:hypothetical protein JXQ70_12660 [bacterium]|nr:hypothetical protein [bacterium]
MSVEKRAMIPVYLVAFVVLFLAFKFGVPYLQNARFENKIQGLINYNKDVYPEPPDMYVVREHIEFAAQQLGIRLDPQKFNIAERDRDLVVEIAYTREVDLYFTKIALHFQYTKRSAL